ncbi:MAG: hypothetical protein FIB08_13355 [Candidatus Methanoperedens sp.]|nr:hypothetical protein [Candidatus Methanoperedens sp.]
MKSFPKWSLTLKVLPLVALIIVLKLAAHQYGVEFISLNPLFTGVVTANIFILGFLLAGVLADYKESEKLPGELAVSIESIVDECLIIYKNKKAKPAEECLQYVCDLTSSLNGWFYKKQRTRVMMEKIDGLNDFFLAFEPLTQANFIVRLKQEQSAIRRMLIRIHAIRETSFVSGGYAIAEAITLLLVIGLLFVRIDPFYEALFFVSAIAFLQTYMIALIKDLDNPFDYDEMNRGPDEISLKPLEDLKMRIEKKIQTLKTNSSCS